MLKCSTRTLQRRIAAGELAAERVNGRTLVAVEKAAPVAVEALERNLEATSQVAGLAAVTGERAALAYQERAEELRRQVAEAMTSRRRWMAAASAAGVVGVVALLMLAASWGESLATRDMVADMRTRAAEAETARTRLEAALVAATSRDVPDVPGEVPEPEELAGPVDLAARTAE